MSDVCLDNGIGLDGCDPEWEPGDASKAWLTHALVEVLSTGCDKPGVAGYGPRTAAMGDMRWHALSELIDQVKTNAEHEAPRRSTAVRSLPSSVKNEAWELVSVYEVLLNKRGGQ